MCKICSGEYKGETFLECCPLVTTIPVIPGLQRLHCIHCPFLTSIDSLASIPGLRELYCNNCPLLTTIPAIPGLRYLNLWRCPLLTSIPVIPGLQELSCESCPWVPQSPSYERRINGLLTLQRFCRKNLRYWRIKNWVGTVACTEWFYHPQNMGGHKHIQRMGKFLSNLDVS
jgi:hypothetical protein